MLIVDHRCKVKLDWPRIALKANQMLPLIGAFVDAGKRPEKLRNIGKTIMRQYRSFNALI